MQVPIKVSGEFGLGKQSLHINYAVRAPLEKIAMNKTGSAPQRRDKLWESTCFEFFIKPSLAPLYFEYNIAPNGDWNCFKFPKYRFGGRSIPDAPVPSVRVEAKLWYFQLHVVLPNIEFFGFDKGSALGIAAVIKDNEGRLSYWALNHLGEKPDFHTLNNFCIPLRW